MSVVYKCKECGGEIEPQENGLGKCLYCGVVQTLPKEKDDKIQNLLNRANDFRLNCDFDRAIFEYEEVLKLSESEPEAHWGLLLSKYGVEYVKDNMTFTYKPTLHRISSISVFDDIDYQATIKYADSISAMQYKKDAENIEMVMKELLLLSANQEPYDVFLSYKELDDVTRQRTDDSYLAHDLYNELTAQGYKVFFAPKSLGVGLYEPKIYSAIISSKVMIVLGTQPKYFDAVWVKNEWSRFAELIDNGEQKVLVPVFKNMEAGQLPNRLAKYQALNMSNISFLQTLTGIIAQSVNRQSRVNFNKDSSAEDAYLERGFLALEDRDFTQANSFFENVLNLNPHNSQAYFGKLMVEMRITKQEQLLTSSKPLKEYSDFEKAVRFADQQLKSVLLKYEEAVDNTLIEKKYNSVTNEITLQVNKIEKEISKSTMNINSVKECENKLRSLYDELNLFNNIDDIKKTCEETFMKIGPRIKEIELLSSLYSTYGSLKGKILYSQQKELDAMFNLLKEKKEQKNRKDSLIEIRSVYERIAELSKVNLKVLEIGDYFFFGTYKGVPLEWRVLAKEEEKVLCITKYCIDSLKYNEKKRNVTWKTCSLRKWLNNDFYCSAFNENQKNKIMITNILNNTDYDESETVVENDTQDKIFLLSKDEANTFFNSNFERCTDCPSMFTKHDWWVTYCDWWLRSKGDGNRSASVVWGNGSDKGHISDNDVNIGNWVRPAMWIHI